ncbi:MAG: hypothetical protein ACLPWD_10375 [Methanobacterium sp.]
MVKPETKGKLMVVMIVSILAFGIGTGTVMVTGLYLNMTNPFNMTLNNTTNQTNITNVNPSIQTNNNINTTPSTSSSNNGQSQQNNNNQNTSNTTGTNK